MKLQSIERKTMKNESVLNISVRSLYDLQKLRVSTGNRICASFRSKLGLTPSQPEEADKEAEAMLHRLRAEYALITDGIKRVTKNTTPKGELITTVAEMQLIESYERLVESETVHEKIIAWELDKEPLWTQWMVDVRGLGPKMAGVILSEIDITACDSISALWKYCGLDVVLNTETGEGEGRSRKSHHLVDKQYTDKLGNEVKTKGISFNPTLKTKMVGVLGGSFIKQGGKYRDIYDGYKNRLVNHPKHAEKTPGHRHAMANRYMVKMFLQDLWLEWRRIEGLPIREPYAVEKLGIVHSK
jgi:hypothetical protein